MANLSIKNVPDELHQRLKERAERHHRSINREVIACLEQIIGPAPRDAAEVLARIRELHKKMPNVWATEEDIQKFKEQGRP